MEKEQKTLIEKIKPWIEVLMLVATLMMAYYTYRAVDETRQLKQADLGPNISLYDLVVTITSNTNTDIRERSWLEGEKIDKLPFPGASVKNISVAFKFNNTGKYSGYLRLLSINDLTDFNLNETKLELPTIQSLIPAGTPTGLVFGYDFIDHFKLESGVDSVFDLNYKFEVSDSEQKNKKTINVYIRCGKIMKTNYQNTYEISCIQIVPY